MKTPSEKTAVVMQQRSSMLASVGSLLSNSLLEALRKKLSYEESALQGLMESEAKRTEAHEKRNKVLNSQFFVQKRLDTSIF